MIRMYHPLMKFLYENIFPKSKLADKPKPWRATLLLELIYGGWTLVCTAVVTSFAKCRDPEYGALLYLFDNYIPLALSIYSVVFKSNKYFEYFLSVYRVWVMFYCFRRRHYDKSPLTYLVSQKSTPFWLEIGTKRYHYSPSGQLSLSVFSLDSHTLHLKIVHQTPEIQACKVKFDSAPETRGFEKGPTMICIIHIFQSTCKL